jgi:hypothetical protein
VLNEIIVFSFSEQNDELVTVPPSHLAALSVAFEKLVRDVAYLSAAPVSLRLEIAGTRRGSLEFLLKLIWDRHDPDPKRNNQRFGLIEVSQVGSFLLAVIALALQLTGAGVDVQPDRPRETPSTEIESAAKQAAASADYRKSQSELIKVVAGNHYITRITFLDGTVLELHPTAQTLPAVIASIPQNPVQKKDDAVLRVRITSQPIDVEYQGQRAKCVLAIDDNANAAVPGFVRRQYALIWLSKRPIPRQSSSNADVTTISGNVTPKLDVKPLSDVPIEFIRADGFIVVQGLQVFD